MIIDKNLILVNGKIWLGWFYAPPSETCNDSGNNGAYVDCFQHIYWDADYDPTSIETSKSNAIQWPWDQSNFFFDQKVHAKSNEICGAMEKNGKLKTKDCDATNQCVPLCVQLKNDADCSTLNTPGKSHKTNVKVFVL